MSKAVLISIQPKWCELIASGKKTIEVRKTRPKIETPFKVYIYQTKRTWVYNIYSAIADWQGKVIGELVCDKIERLSHIGTMLNSKSALVIKNSNGSYSQLIKEWTSKTCLSMRKLENYSNGRDLFTWHISDLKIYDKPKELSEFTLICKEYDKDNPDCEFCAYQSATCDYDTPPQFDCKCNGFKPLTYPPQSWCYVEELHWCYEEK